MSLTLSGIRERDTRKERSSLPREVAKRPRHAPAPLRTSRAYGNEATHASSPLWSSAAAVRQAAEECKDSRIDRPDDRETCFCSGDVLSGDRFAPLVCAEGGGSASSSSRVPPLSVHWSLRWSG